MLKGRSLLEKGACLNVGDGKVIRVWQDPWLPREKNFFINLIKPVGSSINVVNDLILSQVKMWNIPLVRRLFNEEEADIVSRIPIAIHSRRDKWVWHPSPNEIFSVKSAYRLAQNVETSN